MPIGRRFLAPPVKFLHQVEVMHIDRNIVVLHLPLDLLRVDHKMLVGLWDGLAQAVEQFA